MENKLFSYLLKRQRHKQACQNQNQEECRIPVLLGMIADTVGVGPVVGIKVKYEKRDPPAQIRSK